MVTRYPTVINAERFFGEEEIIVSKTDTKGRITYANEVFIRISGYKEAELLGAPHSILRHPDMPRCVFKLLWDTIEAKREIFAYVKNLARTGEYYWVFAHVTPNLNERGEIVGYHSNRRCPERSAIAAIEPVYQALLAEEAKHENRKEGMHAAEALLGRVLSDKGMTYDRLVFAL